jgi:hypothetical protein
MTEEDKKFWAHLQRKLEQDRKDQGLTTMQVLKKRQPTNSKSNKKQK